MLNEPNALNMLIDARIEQLRGGRRTRRSERLLPRRN
jgi:hypothetical protein